MLKKKLFKCRLEMYLKQSCAVAGAWANFMGRQKELFKFVHQKKKEKNVDGGRLF